MIDVVAAVIKKDNKYLIAQRNRNKHFAFYWEFPGGKVDNGETFEIALQREINEELSIGIKIYKKISSQIHRDDKINVKVKQNKATTAGERVKEFIETSREVLEQQKEEARKEND